MLEKFLPTFFKKSIVFDVSVALTDPNLPFEVRDRGNGDPDRIRTYDLRSTNPMLYPAELRNQRKGA